MPSYQQFLFGSATTSRSSPSSTDEVKILKGRRNPGEWEDMVPLFKLDSDKPTMFITDCGDHWLVGRSGNVKDVLGLDHPHAYEEILSHRKAADLKPEQMYNPATGHVNGYHVIRDEKVFRKGRDVPFIHGVYVPKGQPIPDLAELIEQQPKHLEDILERVNVHKDYSDHAPEVTFTRPRQPGTEWDRIASELEKRKRTDKVYSFNNDGSFERPPFEAERKTTGKSEAGAASFQERLRAFSEMPKSERNLVFAAVSGVALAVTGLFIGQHKAKDANGEPAKKNWVESVAPWALGLGGAAVATAAGVAFAKGGGFKR